MTAYPYRLRRSFLLLILLVMTSVLVPIGHSHHTDGHVRAAACADPEVVPAHEHRTDVGAVSQVASRAWLAARRTVVTVRSAPAPALTAEPLIAHVELRLPGVLRV